MSLTQVQLKHEQGVKWPIRTRNDPLEPKISHPVIFISTINFWHQWQPRLTVASQLSIVGQSTKSLTKYSSMICFPSYFICNNIFFNRILLSFLLAAPQNAFFNFLLLLTAFTKKTYVVIHGLVHDTWSKESYLSLPLKQIKSNYSYARNILKHPLILGRFLPFDLALNLGSSTSSFGHRRIFRDFQPFHQSYNHPHHACHIKHIHQVGYCVPAQLACYIKHLHQIEDCVPEQLRLKVQPNL